MKASGSYILSNYKNNVSPKYVNCSNRSRSPTNDSLGPGQCNFFEIQMILVLRNLEDRSFPSSKSQLLAPSLKKNDLGSKTKAK